MAFDDYETREIQRYLAEVARIRKAPLAERKENAAAFLNALATDPALVAERVGWLLSGNYGQGAALKAHQVAASPRMNRPAALSLMTGELEWHAPEDLVRRGTRKLPPGALERASKLVQKEIDDYLKEDPLGYVSQGMRGGAKRGTLHDPRPRRRKRERHDPSSKKFEVRTKGRVVYRGESEAMALRAFNWLKDHGKYAYFSGPDERWAEFDPKRRGRDPARHKLLPRWSPKTLKRYEMRVLAAKSARAHYKRLGKAVPRWAKQQIAASVHPRGTAGFYREPREVQEELMEKWRDPTRRRITPIDASILNAVSRRESLSSSVLPKSQWEKLVEKLLKKGLLGRTSEGHLYVTNAGISAFKHWMGEGRDPARRYPPYPKGRAKVRRVLEEFAGGKLRSSSGQRVKSRKQAVAIALSEQRRAEHMRSRDPRIPASRLNRNEIQRALSYVHHWEKERGRVEAAREAIRHLSDVEAEILLRSIHVDPSELERGRDPRRSTKRKAR